MPPGASSPIDVRGYDGAGPGKVSHRTKHRKEVKRYHQRQQNKHLREEAKARDAQLFLFEAPEIAASGADHTQDGAHEPPAGEALTSSALTTAAQKGVVAMSIPGGSPPPQPTSAQNPHQQIQLASALTASAAGTAEAVTPAHALTSTCLSSWDFEFLLRASPESAVAASSTGECSGFGSCATDAVALSTIEEATTCRSLSVVEPLKPQAVVSTVQRGRVRPPAATSRHLQIPATATSGDQPPPPDSCAPQHSSASRSANWDRISMLPIYKGASSTITKLLNSTHVQRVEGVEAIPMQAPLAPGTDINRPPRTYLTLDTVHNTHQHAPGFLRNQRVALQHMLASAVMEWKDMQQSALIVSSAEAMRTIFEQVYVPERPLALRVQRIGPMLVIDSRASEPSEVHEMRQQALFGKALYLMKETHGQAIVDADEAAAGAAGQLALALPERRLSSVAASDVDFGANLHRYSQVLRWRMDATEVLIGIDAPIVMDQRTSTEQLVRMKEKVPIGAVDAQQRETLRCWFDAMMANVPQVGTYVHHDGVVQSHQVKKTMDILDSVEARMAAAALSFTSRALQWLVKQCRRDGGIYAVVRDYPLEYVELYELPDLDDSAAFVEETDKYFGGAAAAFASAVRSAAPRSADGEAYIESEVPATTLSGYGLGAPSTAPQLNRFNWNFGKTCFNIGQHLFRSGDLSRSGDALPLLHRSLRIFLPSCREDLVARETVAELVRMVPVLVARKLQVDAAQTEAAVVSNSTAGCAQNAAVSWAAGLCSSPEVYRDALLLCGRFEIPLRHMFVEAGRWEGGQLMRAFFARCLVTCSAAACTVVAMSLEAYYRGCHHLHALRMARNEAKAKEGKAAWSGVDHWEEVMAAISSCTQDLLQVVVEGLVRLEEASELVASLHSAAAATLAKAAAGTSATRECTSLNGATPVSKDLRGSKEQSLLPKASMGSCSSSLMESSSQPLPPTMLLSHTSEPAGLKKCSRSADVATVSGSCSTVLDPRTQVDITPLRFALCELYGDVAVIAMSDASTGFSVRTLTELARRMEARLQKCGLKPPTTLVWVETLKADVVSLSFTALRFYGRIGTQTRRHLMKLALVYYLVGKEHHLTARYTKSLEALHRAKALLHASHKAAEDTVFGAAFGSHSMLQWADVMQMLGDVYRSIVERKLSGALGVASVTLAQPLLVSPLHDLPEDADSFFTQALSAYTEGGLDSGCRSAKAYTLLLYASVLMERLAVSGVPATHAASQRIAQLIQEAEELVPSMFVQEREWQTLRLFTVTSATMQDTALVRAVEKIVLHTTTVTGVPASSLHIVQNAPVTGADGGDDNAADGSATRKGSQLVYVNTAEYSGCRRERCVSLPSWPMLLELQKALVCCAMVEREARQSQSRPPEATKVASTEAKYRGLLRWVGRAAGYLTSVVEYCELHSSELQGAAARHQWQSVLRSWREQEPSLLMHRLVSMIALRLLGAAQALLPGMKQQEARGAVKQIACILHDAATVKASAVEGRAAAIQQLLRDLNVLLAPFVEW